MQKIIATGLSVYEYQANPEHVLTAQHCTCSICPSPHRLWRHGRYFRTAILEGGKQHLIPVLRLRCPRTATTVSLLPDFCLPRRQHGPALLGVFLEALLIGGLSLVGAMRRARPDAPAGHSLPQSLLAGFRRRLPTTRTWLAARRARAPTPSVPSFSVCTSRWPVEAAAAVAWLLEFGESAAAAFTRAGREVHDLTGASLA